MKLNALQKLAQTMEDTRGADVTERLRVQLRSIGLDPNAIYQELEMSSRYVDTHADTSRTNDHVQLHSHVFYELIYCRNYCNAEYLVGSERYRLEKGDIIFIPPGVSHRPLLPEQMDVPYERYVLWLSAEFMSQFTNLLGHPFGKGVSAAGMLRTRGTEWEQLGELFRMGVEEAQRRTDGWEAALIGNTMTLLTSVCRAAQQHMVRPLRAEAPELLDRITAYVERNYAKPITLPELSRQFYVSDSTVSHLFKQKLGVSVHRYVTQRRLIAAKTRIESGEALEDVAIGTGFGDYSVFYRAFKRTYGISPRQYRALQEEGR